MNNNIKVIIIKEFFVYLSFIDNIFIIAFEMDIKFYL